jgi:hypothetical protein
MQTFRPCAGKSVCNENENHCLVCGRSLEAIARTRQLVDELTRLAQQENYDNPQDFLAYVSHRVLKKLDQYQAEGQVSR